MSIISDVSLYIKNEEGRPCHVDDIATATGYTPKQIRGAINGKRHEDPTWHHILKNVVRGHIWSWNMLYDPTKPVTSESDPEKNLYEQIGVTKNGDLILQDEDGNLFRASELA